MRRITALLLILMMIPGLMATAEEDFDLSDILDAADPEIVKDTFLAPDDDPDSILLDDDNQIVSIYEDDGSILITLTATGDFTVGGDSRKSTSIWENELKKHDGDPNFALANVRDIFLNDDLTIVNFEGTLTESTYIPSNKRENEFLFSAPPSYVSMLTDNGIEAVSLENNHVMDHGQEVYEETQQHLTDAGIIWSNSDNIGVYEVKGIQICMLSYLCIDRYSTLWDKVPADIAAAKEQYPLVIVSFHWGNEKDYSPTNNQIKMGRLAVDSGADLVIGHHSHRLNPIEYYNGVYICYSLGNFCFAGNSKPSDMSSFIFQTRWRIWEDEGEITNEGFRIIPIRISSRSDRNDFTPTPFGDGAARDAVLTTLKSYGSKLDYAVSEYPLEW